MLHLATHGVFNKVNPLLSGLELEADVDNDGLLQVHEVLGLRLHADLVTLSACETALGSGYFAEVPAGDEFVGMTRAFLAAGSSSVVATLWDVDDRASVTLMPRFYERLKQSSATESTADSLTRAQRELHASKALAHPYYWAPFVVVGPMSRIRPPRDRRAQGDDAMKALKQLGLATFALLVLALAPLGVAEAQVKVTAATPSSTYQGTVSLDVVVNGSGFDNTAKVQFLVSGTTNPGGITVKKVAFHNSGEVVATIDVADTANIANFDIVVMLSDGRKGKGTTLFAVHPSRRPRDPCAVSGLNVSRIRVPEAEQQQQLDDLRCRYDRKMQSRNCQFGRDASSDAFSYPISGTTNRGRVTWKDSGGVVGVDFTASGNTMAVEPLRTIYSPTGCCLADLSRDGQTLYFSLTDTVLAKLDLSLPNASPVPFYAFDTTPYGAQRGSVNGDQTFLFLEEFEADSTTKLMRLSLPPAPVTRTVLPTFANGPFWVAANLDDGRIAFLEYVAGTNYCGQLVVTDSDGLSRQIFTNRFGKFATWLGSNVLMERESVDRRGNCSLTGTISQVAPDNTETVLTNGTGPNGP